MVATFQLIWDTAFETEDEQLRGSAFATVVQDFREIRNMDYSLGIWWRSGDTIVTIFFNTRCVYHTSFVMER